MHKQQLSRLNTSFETIYDGFDYGTPAMKANLRKLTELYAAPEASKDQLLHIISMQQALFMQLIDAQWIGKPLIPKSTLSLRPFVQKYYQQLPGKTSTIKRTWIEVLKFLDVSDVVKFSKTCQRNYRAAYDEEVWKLLCTRKFGTMGELVQIDNWRLKVAYRVYNSCCKCRKFDANPYVKLNRRYCNLCKMQLEEFRPKPVSPPRPEPVRRLGYTVRCEATTLRGTRCKRMTYNGSGYCWQHE
mmetsp:Transcript_7751/g.14716  ORF Transcript_7751/g.14716 Transcript_7751/m.14716 type:complete len:243 (-) Transcript_7751:336-1064(-)